ncbi:MAG: TetR/AcrR family transcriptional regulator [Eggerthellaceae bacterium]|nr:TetR/AcrR family transcriptional regulator [Eggerthellaceae bacterium]
MSRTRAYKTKTEQSIKDALVRLLAAKPLEDVTISELAREAHVSRSTFYGHYGNTNDVYNELVRDASSGMSPLMSQVMCTDGFKPEGRPFCMLVRDAGEYAPVVCEPRFADAFLRQTGTQESHDLYAMMIEAGYSHSEAQAVSLFQLNGCFSAARTMQATDEEWKDIRAVIDRFILGGIAACLAAKRG